MAETVRFYAFKVSRGENSRRLDEVLSEIQNSRPIGARVRTIGRRDIRVEHISRPGQASNYWRMDFVMLRHSRGPGHAANDREVEGLTLPYGNSFAEETSALYDPERGYLVIESNHQGAKAGRISTYFGNFNGEATDKFEFLPTMDQQISARIDNQKVFRRIEVSVDIAALLENPYALSGGNSLSSIISSAEKTGASTVAISFGVGSDRRGRLIGSEVKKLIGHIRKSAKKDSPAFTRGVIHSKRDDDSQVEAIDLLEERLFADIGDLAIGSDRRIPREDRYRALERAYASLRPKLR